MVACDASAVLLSISLSIHAQLTMAMSTSAAGHCLSLPTAAAAIAGTTPESMNDSTGRGSACRGGPSPRFNARAASFAT
eukprot:2278600-Pyramimonas_sp.AAC.1